MNLSKPMEYSFLESIPNKLLCRICRLPCCQAKSSKCCGHLYCGPCLDKMNYINCPACQIRAFIVEPEPAIDREILSLRVFCPNRIRGCEWSGELARVLDQDKGRNSHFAKDCPCYCQYCGMTSEREVITNEHKEKCIKFPLTCPNNCGLDLIPQNEMDDHIKMCPLEIIECDQAGCTSINVYRKDMMCHKKNHWQKKYNYLRVFKLLILILSILISILIFTLIYKQTEITNSHIKVKESILRMQHKLSTYPWPRLLDVFSEQSLSNDQMTPVIFKINPFTKLKKFGRRYNVTFFAFEGGYKMRLKIYANGYGNGKDTHVSVILALLKGPHDNELQRSGNWPLRGIFMIELLNQVGDSNHRMRNISYNSNTSSACAERVWYDEANGLSISRFISHSALGKKNDYLKDDAIYFRISYEHELCENISSINDFEYPILLPIYYLANIVTFTVLVKSWEHCFVIYFLYCEFFFAILYIATSNVLGAFFWTLLVITFIFYITFI